VSTSSETLRSDLSFELIRTVWNRLCCYVRIHWLILTIREHRFDINQWNWIKLILSINLITITSARFDFQVSTSRKFNYSVLDFRNIPSGIRSSKNLGLLISRRAYSRLVLNVDKIASIHRCRAVVSLVCGRKKESFTLYKFCVWLLQKELFGGGEASQGDGMANRKMSNGSTGSPKLKWLKAFKSLKTSTPTTPPLSDKWATYLLFTNTNFRCACRRSFRNDEDDSPRFPRQPRES